MTVFSAVRAEDGLPVAGVTLALRQVSATGIVFDLDSRFASVTTGANGLATVTLRRGSYSATATVPGYATAVAKVKVR